MAREVFVDTSGFYALLVRRDDCHRLAAEFVAGSKRRRRRFVTTDYILDETATLLKARGHGHLIEAFFDSVLKSEACRVEWTDPGRFGEAGERFIKYSDHDWSFTDALSFVAMRALGCKQALTKDVHFQEAGFDVLLGAERQE